MFLKANIDFCKNTDPFALIPSCSEKADYSKIKFSQLMVAATPWNIVFSGITIFFIFKAKINFTKLHPDTRFARTHTLDSFMDEQKEVYPHLRIYSEFNLLKINQNLGPLMGMKTVQEFAFENGLVYADEPRIIKTIDNGVTKSQDDQSEKVPVIDREVLIPILRTQLGSLWVGVDHLTDAEAILLAMYLPRACSTDPTMLDKEFHEIFQNCQVLENQFWDIAAKEILEDEKFAPCGVYPDGTPIYPEGKKSLSNFNINECKAKVAHYINYAVPQKLLSKHAYTRTFIIAVVYQARRLGVMAPCQLRWLKFYDREMWALLQNIGRPSFYSENIGSVSHYTAETVAGKMIYQPQFDIGIKGYEYQIKTYFYTPQALERLKSQHYSNKTTLSN